MWNYERKLLYPVKIKNKNPRLAQIVISQYGGPDIGCFSISQIYGIEPILRFTQNEGLPPTFFKITSCNPIKFFVI